MSKLNYDIHIHSALSPCGDEEMSPNNIVNMASLCGLDMIALTDHNSARNCRAAVAAGQRASVHVVPGMELCTVEEIHMVCLLPTVDAAEKLSRIVWDAMPPIDNKADIFGRQLVMDDRDEIIGEEQRLLINACSLGIYEAAGLVRSLGGACFPAHIDKASYSVFSMLGDLPPECDFKAAEIFDYSKIDEYLQSHPSLRGMMHLRNSDAHRLEQIGEKTAWIDLPECTNQAIIDAINGKIICGCGF